MLNILRYLKKHVRMAVLILALLCVQAYCDLTLPRYTSDIVDVGIQQSGVERVTPEQMRGSTLEALTLFLSDEDETVLREAYTSDGNGVYTLAVRDKDTLDRLDEILSLPMVALYQKGRLHHSTPCLGAPLKGYAKNTPDDVLVDKKTGEQG